MRTIALRTKTVLATLTGAGVLTLGITAGTAAAVEHGLVHMATSHTGPALADDKPPASVVRVHA
ncbi:hypothetical protein AB0L75_22355 [Streptomyces sp. NPDC052101]|uniref:hypothetical protein n=1 Tax=Streptomyces sp. NPDC052101 TaxID=3155763 RepID=UPI0034484972